MAGCKHYLLLTVGYMWNLKFYVNLVSFPSFADSQVHVRFSNLMEVRHLAGKSLLLFYCAAV